MSETDTPDPDADPEILSSGAGGEGAPDTSGGVDGVATASSVQDDPDDDDDPDADPQMLSSSS